jgi:hypothetical protein
MFNKIHIANRGENGCKAVSVKPSCLVREAHAGEFYAETSHV